MTKRVRRALAIAAALSFAAAATSFAGTSDGPPSQDARARADADAHRLMRRPAMSRPITQVISPAQPMVVLDKTRDYRLVVEQGTVFTAGVQVIGGHNVVLEDAELVYVRPPDAPLDWRVRGLYLKGQTGIAWVSGLTIRGPLNEGLDLDQRNSRVVVVLNDVETDPVVGSASGHHADLLQTWAGPWKLIVNNFHGASNYQGFFLEPNQKFEAGPKPTYFWFDNVELDLRLGYYALWADGANPFPVWVRHTSVIRNPSRLPRDRWLWPQPSKGDRTWANVVGR